MAGEKDSGLDQICDEDGNQKCVNHPVQPPAEHLQLRPEKQLAHDQAYENDRERLIYHVRSVAFVTRPVVRENNAARNYPERTTTLISCRA